MRTSKTFRIIMLPTEKESNIHSYIYRLGLIDRPKKTYQMNGNSQICYAQYLYIISDEKPKEGDWYIDDTGLIRQSITSDKDYWSKRKDYKKIVATTDTSLTISKGLDSFSGKPNLLPQLPESFIQAYIKAYNEGKPITEVDLEVFYNDHIRRKHLGEVGVGQDPEHVIASVPQKYIGYHLKIREDNTVIVHQSKMYSKAEVIKLLLEAPDGLEIHKWISENL